ncbi:MAG TPA: histidine phosphatase family protein, partial [Candidatus Nitrosotenuis sp.]|nr:histidine phosphatase family protein [Candidatus Nitrosotenuis sp.]
MLVKKSFYFVRHGETDHNRRLLCAGGGTDIPLNEIGQH